MAQGKSGATAELVDIVPSGNTLGEGVLWDEGGGAVWWTDIQEKRLFRCRLGENKLEVFRLPERLGSFGFVEGNDKIVAAFESGLAFYRPSTGDTEWIKRVDHGAPNVRFNDGRVDRRGRFWSGSMTEGEGAPRGKLYRLGRGGEVTTHMDDIAISNSICFSPDGKHLYFADTPQRTILRYDIGAGEGTISNRTVFAKTAEGAFPDGSNVDRDGFLWNAQWAAGRVVRYAPDGSVDAEIEVPAAQPTCVAFGGENLDLLFVTSAREGLKQDALERQPHAGDVFVYRTNVKGLIEPRFVW